MKRARRDIQVFSLSALDLFASAMGAFMIITLIIFPYYQNTSKAEQLVDGMAQSQSDLKALVDEAEGDARSAVQAADRIESEVPSPEEIAALEEEIARLDSENEEQLEKLDALAEEYERSIPFSILGVETDADKIVVLVDMSGSMKDYSDLMIRTFQRLLTPFDETVELSVIGFQEWYGDNLKFWPRQGEFAAMTDQQKAQATRFANNLRSQFDGRTPTFEALSKAVSMNPDAIFLISDGEPTDLDGNWQQIVETISLRNRSRARIHSIALGNYTYSVDLIAFLRDLASQNRGSFVGVMR